jgi:hypothetical protein
LGRRKIRPRIGDEFQAIVGRQPGKSVLHDLRTRVGAGSRQATSSGSRQVWQNLRKRQVIEEADGQLDGEIDERVGGAGQDRENDVTIAADIARH